MIDEILEHHILDHSLNFFGLPLTQVSLMMLIVSAVILFVFIFAAHRKTGRLRTVAEMFVMFVRDDLVLPNLHEKGRKLVPFFCSLFIFILFSNYLGMLPWARTVTANISVTAGLALISLFIIVGQSIKNNGFWGFTKTFIPGGVPWWLIPLMFPLEVLSLIIRIFVLAIRLFANMTAGHIMLISLISFIFIIGMNSIKAGFVSVAPVITMTLFVSILELLVAVIQAYVFTLLSVIFTSLQLEVH
ncbi:MAG: F0F1 ATP synthase subunit A [Elusimicrobiaceae bacterium]|nr:F0F1 ATP synthase subunit A [Elusimicrobiaceae bacterium]